MSKKRNLRTTFDQEALLYDAARPGYPEAVFVDILTFAHIPENGQIVEIGCGTGQATLPFARRGYTIHCIELGPNLAAAAAHRLAPYPAVRVDVGSFEDYPLPENTYDLVFSATAFHWIDPAVGYQKAAGILRPGGTLALFWTKPVQTAASAECVRSIQEIYQEVVPELARRYPGLPHPDDIPTPVKDEIAQSALFGPVTIHKYKWDASYTAHAYTALLGTYSDHINLPEPVRTKLLARITNRINTRFGGQILKEHLTLLYLAHRTPS